MSVDGEGTTGRPAEAGNAELALGWWMLAPGVLIAVWLALTIQTGHPLVWDEIEFHRATKWIAEGRMPFRDYWEHHTPLQWFLFAPFAALFGRGPGVAAVIAMRWAQALLWVAMFALLWRLMRRSGLSQTRCAIAILLLLASPVFVAGAVEYRVDVPGNFAYFAALVPAVTRPRRRASWFVFGVAMSAAVLANLRMAPLVIATAMLLALLRLDENRWGLNRFAFWMIPGVGSVAALALLWLIASGAWAPFLEVMRLNFAIDRILASETATLFPTLLLPLTRADVTAVALWVGAVAGAFLALGRIRRPGVPQLFALLAILSLVALGRLGIHYGYHLQTSFLLMAPLAAGVITTRSGQRLVVALIAGVTLVHLAGVLGPGYGEPMRYLDSVMREADRRTTPQETVWDGCGYALRREPAHRYWFLPSIVRLATNRGMLEPYDARQMIAAPPGAVIHGVRVNEWLRTFPSLASYATHHYIPLYRDLWVPGMSARIEPGRDGALWIVPRGGTYRVVASELLGRHPWFRNPLGYAAFPSDEAGIFEVELSRLPPADPSRMTLDADGRVLSGPVFTLRKGERLRLRSDWSEPVGVVVAPADATRLFTAPRVPYRM